MVPCEIYPVVWQAWEGVFGCVCIKEAKTGTISRKRYVVDVLFCFSAHLLLSGLVISVCVGIWRPWFTYLLLWLKINTAFILNLTKVFCFHGFLGIAEYTFQLQDRLSALIPPCSGTHKLLYKKRSFFCSQSYFLLFQVRIPTCHDKPGTTQIVQLTQQVVWYCGRIIQHI